MTFTFGSGGQVASVTVVNYPPGAQQAPEAPASPIYDPKQAIAWTAALAVFALAAMGVRRRQAAIALITQA